MNSPMKCDLSEWVMGLDAAHCPTAVNSIFLNEHSSLVEKFN